MFHYEVLAAMKLDDVVSHHTENVRATDPDDACGKAITALVGTYGDCAEVLVKRITRQNIGGAAELVEV